MDKRPESTMQGGLLYCQKKRLVVRPKTSCDVYIKATAKNIESMKAALYGKINPNDVDWGGASAPAPMFF